MSAGLPSSYTPDGPGKGFQYHKRGTPESCKTIIFLQLTYRESSFSSRSFICVISCLNFSKFLKCWEKSVARIFFVISYFIFRGFVDLEKMSMFFYFSASNKTLICIFYKTASLFAYFASSDCFLISNALLVPKWFRSWARAAIKLKPIS